MIAAPMLGQRFVPPQVKILFALIFGYFLYPLVGSQGVDPDPGLLPLFVLAAREFLFGLLIGFLFEIIFLAVQFAGGILGYQIGFALVNVVDPSTSDSVPIIGQFKMLIATLIFFLIDGHHIVLQALFESFKVVPLGHAVFKPIMIDSVVRYTGALFAIGIKIAAPVIVMLFLTDVCLGIVARTMPQMNMLIVGFQLKIGTGLLTLAVALPLFHLVFTKVFNQMSIDVVRMTPGFAG